MSGSLKSTDVVLHRLLAAEASSKRSLIDLSPGLAPSAATTGILRAGYPSTSRSLRALEELGQARALKLFGLNSNKWRTCFSLDSVDTANTTALMCVTRRGDRVLTLDSALGGPLLGAYGDRGHHVSSWAWNTASYSSHSDMYVDLDTKVREFQPAAVVVGGPFVPMEIDFERVRAVVGPSIKVLCDLGSHTPLAAARACKSPFKYADLVTVDMGGLGGPVSSAALFYDKTLHPRVGGLARESRVSGSDLAAACYVLKEASKVSYPESVGHARSNTTALAAALRSKGYGVRHTDTCLLVWDFTNESVGLDNLSELSGLVGLPLQFRDSTALLGTLALTRAGVLPEHMEELSGMLDVLVRRCKAIESLSLEDVDVFRERVTNSTDVVYLRKQVDKFSARFDTPKRGRYKKKKTEDPEED